MASIVCACGKPVETKPEWAGQWIACPSCGGSLYAPFPGPKPSEPAVASPPPSPDVLRIDRPMRLCGTCSETIPDDHQACKFCGAGGPAVAAAPPRPASRPAASTPVDTSDRGTGALIVGLVGYMFCGLLCPIAWALGSGYEKDCRARGVEPSGAGRAGKIIGIIGTVFLALNVLGLALWLVAACL